MLNVYTSKHWEGGGGGAESSVGQRGVVECTAVSCVPRPPLPPPSAELCTQIGGALGWRLPRLAGQI